MSVLLFLALFLIPLALAAALLIWSPLGMFLGFVYAFAVPHDRQRGNRRDPAIAYLLLALAVLLALAGVARYGAFCYRLIYGG